MRATGTTLRSDRPFLARADFQDGLARAEWRDLRPENLGLRVVSRVVQFAFKNLKFRAMGGVSEDCKHAFSGSELDGRR